MHLISETVRLEVIMPLSLEKWWEERNTSLQSERLPLCPLRYKLVCWIGCCNEKRERLIFFPSVGGNYWRKVARLRRAGYTTRTRKTRSIFLANNAHPKAKGGRTLPPHRPTQLTASCLDRIQDAAGSCPLLTLWGKGRRLSWSQSSAAAP